MGRRLGVNRRDLRLMQSTIAQADNHHYFDQNSQVTSCFLDKFRKVISLKTHQWELFFSRNEVSRSFCDKWSRSVYLVFSHARSFRHSGCIHSCASSKYDFRKQSCREICLSLYFLPSPCIEWHALQIVTVFVVSHASDIPHHGTPPNNASDNCNIYSWLITPFRNFSC